MRNLLHRSLMCSLDYKNYFTIVALENGLTVSLSSNDSYYRINKGAWHFLSAGENTIAVKSGQKIQFKANPKINTNTTGGIGTFHVNDKMFNVEGNILSLLYGSEFDVGYHNFVKEKAFVSLFDGCETLNSAKNLLLPNDVADGCYALMFNGCISLIEPPVLPAQTLENNCYYSMFYGCTSLTKAPELPAKSLYNGCYNHMFYGCSNLNYIKMMATSYANGGAFCLENWVEGVASRGTFVKDFDFNLQEGVNGIPLGWDYNKYDYFTIVALEKDLTVSISRDSNYRIDKGTWTNLNANVSTPKINSGQKIQFKINRPANMGTSGIGTFHVNDKMFNVEGDIMSLLYGDNYYVYNGGLVNYSFNSLFKDCKTLISAKDLILPTYTYSHCYSNMFYGCTSLTTPPTLPATSLTEWCYENMFLNCTSLTTAPDLPAISLASHCYYRMFSYCESLSSNILLPAKKLEENCYWEMFYRCSKVNHITMLATEIVPGSLFQWVSGVANSGTFVKDPITILERGISGIPEKWEIYDPNDKYFTIVALEDDLTVTIDYTSNIFDYSIDGGKWNTLNPFETKTTEMVKKGQEIRFRTNDANNINIYEGDGICTFKVNKPFDVEGNIMSLFFGDDFLGQTDLSGYDGVFEGLFWQSTTIRNAKNLFLPATTLSECCYAYMFYNCTSLTSAPDLPPTTLTYGCYNNMFHGCTSLINAPELPATTLAEGCYYCMFQGCTSLTNAPDLPATKLAYGCYEYMLQGCTSLINAPELPATTLAENCYSLMFNGCTSLTNAPDLPATTLAECCYQYMFQDCISLVSAPALPATILADECYYSMFYGCTSLTKAPELPALKLTKGCYAYMFQSCSNLNYIKMLAIKTDDVSYCLSGWVSDNRVSGFGVAEEGTFIKHEYNDDLVKGSINGIPKGWTLETTTFTQQCFTIESLEKGNEISINFINDDKPQYSLDFGKTWYIFGGSKKFTINENECISFKSSSTPSISSGIGNIKATKKYKTFGNIMSLLYHDNFKENDKINRSYTFYHLFEGSDTLIDAENLMLPAKELYDSCYREMFVGCTSLISAPILRSETLAYDCYREMFAGCTSLVNAPELISENLNPYCYYGMFRGCTSLKYAPVLPALTMKISCYQYMFEGCASLVSAPKLNATSLENASSCYKEMFSGCISLTSVPDLPATTLEESCYWGMFKDCTSLTTAPSLSATRLAKDCCAGMFNGCTSLEIAPTLKATTLADGCYSAMFEYCTSLKNAPSLQATTLANQCYEYMFQGCTSLKNAPEVLPGNELKEYCYASMFNGCTSLVNPPSINAYRMDGNYCCQEMFRDCKSLLKSPVLYSSTLSVGCYNYMFKGCNSLKEIKIHATGTISSGGMSSNCLYNWVSGVAIKGDFYKNSNAIIEENSINGIPTGWTPIDI